jgi:hypothetical protein
MTPIPTPIPTVITTRRRSPIVAVAGIAITLTVISWALSVALLQARAERAELEQVIAFRDCVGRVTDLMLDAYDGATPPTLVASSKITTLCDTLTFGGVR